MAEITGAPVPTRSLARRLGHHASQVVPALLTLGLAVFLLRSADLGRVAGLLRSLGWWLPLLLLPNFVVTLAEGVGWHASFGALGVRPRFPSLLRVRLAVEAVMLGLPSGAVISESLQPYLLKRRCEIPFETAVVASVGRKFFVVVSHGLVLGAVTLLAWPVLSRASREMIGRGGLPWLLLASALFMIATFGVGIVAGAHSQMAERLRRLLGRFGGKFLGSWVERNALRFERADEHFLRFFALERSGLVVPLLLYLLGWVVRACETLLYLHLLGARVSFTTATVLESALILVRSVAVPIPAGLGVQDVGYVLSFRALGIPDATTVGTAFVLLKRSKDLFWILVGAVLLVFGERRDGSPGPGPAPQTAGLGTS
jgi:glycosyltransferase 2 family protein